MMRVKLTFFPSIPHVHLLVFQTIINCKVEHSFRISSTYNNYYNISQKLVTIHY